MKYKYYVIFYIFMNVYVLCYTYLEIKYLKLNISS